MRLILIRHAKSAWDEPGLDDHDRPLNKRGVRAADALGTWLAARILPDQVLCSSARRARQTWERIAAALPEAPAPVIEGRLYNAEPHDILSLIRAAEGETLAVVGHNPDLGAFTAQILAEPPRHPRFADYPTGATTIAEFEAESWREIGWRQGRARDFVVPRELT